MKIPMASAFVAMLVIAAASSVHAQEMLTRRGAEIEGKFVTPIGSKIDRRGDVFTLAVQHAPDENAIPPGSLIEGHIVSVLRATSRHGARMELSLDQLKTSRASGVSLRLRITSLVSGGAGVTVASPSTLASRDKGDIVVKRGALLRLKALEDIVLSPPIVAKPAREPLESSTPTPRWHPSAYTDELI